MKRSLAPLLVSLLLVFTLAACGGDNKDTGTNGNNSAVTGTENNSAGGNQAGDSLANPPSNELGNGGIMDGTKDSINSDRNHTGGSRDNSNVTDSVEKQASRPGVSYEQMLRNGRVRDGGGLLKNLENDLERAVTPRSAR